MYKKHKIILCFLGVISLIVGILNLDNPSEAHYNSVITFLSILFGFTLTSFTTLFSSKSVDGLYKIQDKKNRNITLKHRLKNYFLASFNISVISILILLLFPNKLSVCHLCFHKEMFLYPIIIINSYMYYILLHLLGKIFIKNNT